MPTPALLYRILSSDAFFAFNLQHAKGAKMPRGSKAMIMKILPPVARFSKYNNHSAKKQTVLDTLAAFFERYSGLA